MDLLPCISEVNKTVVVAGCCCCSAGFGSTGSPCNGGAMLKFASLEGLALEAVLEEHAA